MKLRLKTKPILAAVMSVALCATMALAQDQASKPKSTSSGDLPDLIELDPFGGVSLFQQVFHGLNTKHITGGALGFRAGYNFTDHWEVEAMYEYMVNNVRFNTPLAPGLPRYDFGNRIHYLALNPVFNVTPRGSRFRPYITAGIGAAQFTPTSAAERIARDPTVNLIYGSSNLNDNLQVALNYGGGLKVHLMDRIGLRFDARGFVSRNPTYNLPSYPTGGIYIPHGDKLNGLQLTAGLIFYLGKKAEEVVAPPVVVVPPPPLAAGSITGGDGVLCQGKSITLHSTASDPAGHQLGYAWKLNGAPQGSNSPDFTFTPNNAGDFTVEVVVSDTTNPSRTVTGGPITLSVKEYTEPVISSFAVSPNTLSCREKDGPTTSELTSSASGSACGGNLTYKWTVSEGTVSNDTSPNASFDAKSLNFDQSSAQEQTKSVTATLTVTDETGKSVSKSDTITVNCKPQMVRFSDLVFPKNNSRVNNCGKRILIDEVAPKLNDPNYNVVLVGHVDKDELKTETTRKGKRRKRTMRALDEARALNAAAVLTGGTGTCAKVDPSRVMVDWVGDDQTSDPNPGLCGTSTREATKERRSSEVSDADKFRRVEVYLVPKGGAMPPAVKDAKPLPESTMKELGCPK